MGSERRDTREERQREKEKERTQDRNRGEGGQELCLLCVPVWSTGPGIGTH